MLISICFACLYFRCLRWILTLPCLNYCNKSQTACFSAMIIRTHWIQITEITVWTFIIKYTITYQICRRLSSDWLRKRNSVIVNESVHFLAHIFQLRVCPSANELIQNDTGKSIRYLTTTKLDTRIECNDNLRYSSTELSKHDLRRSAEVIISTDCWRK